MGKATKCFHCRDGELTVGIEIKEDNEILFHCGKCKSSFRFDIEERPVKQPPIKERRPEQYL